MGDVQPRGHRTTTVRQSQNNRASSWSSHATFFIVLYPLILQCACDCHKTIVRRAYDGKHRSNLSCDGKQYFEHVQNIFQWIYDGFFFVHYYKQGKFEWFDSCDRPSNLSQIGFKSSIFRPCDLEIWWMTPKNNILLYNIKLCVSFHIHQWIETGVTLRKRPIWVKLDDFFSCVTLQFDVWPWKTIGHLFNATSSFVHHSVAIGELQLELQSGNAQFGSNSMIFRGVWPLNLTDDLEK